MTKEEEYAKRERRISLPLAVTLIAFIMPKWTTVEYADMYLFYGEARRDAGLAARLFAERNPGRPRPSRKVFRDLDARVRETGRITPEGCGGRPPIIEVDQEEAILECVEDDPTLSCRDLERVTGISKSTINCVLRANGYHPYHLTKVQNLHDPDAELRLQFCNRFMEMYQEDANILSNIMWTDESIFTREGVFNQHNLHNYAKTNPFVTRPRSYQHRWSIHVWAGIAGTRVFFAIFPPRLNGAGYLEFLEQGLVELLEDVPLAERPLWFQQDGAPPHNTNAVRDRLNGLFPGRWFGMRGPHRWPPRSPDLTPLDFFLWGFLKEKVYSAVVATPEEAEERLRQAIAQVDAAVLQRVQQSVLRRVLACIDAEGRQFVQQL